MVNSVVLVGRLGSAPELRHSPSGTAVVQLRLAVDRPRRGEDSEDHTDWLNVVAWGTVAENCSRYLDKGALVAVEGRVQSRSWQTRDGQRRYTVEIGARAVHFLESRQEAERRRAAGPGQAEETPPGEESSAPVPEVEDIFGDE